MKKLIALIALSMGFAHASEMRTNTDTFTGEVETYFIGSVNGGSYIVSRMVTGSAMLTVRARDGITDCTRYPLLIKTSDSKIHQLNATEVRSKSCHALMSHDLLKGGVIVRIPMYNKTDIDLTIDTTNMDWASMGKRKAEQ
jgi:hypothetical protein